MADGVKSWSTTADNNGSADSTINFAEGQAPSSVNNSARALMAGVKKWYNDLGGTNTTAGTSAAYTLSSNVGFDSLTEMDGATICVKFHTENAVNATLNVDGLGAKGLAIGGAAIKAGVIGTNQSCLCVYRNSASQWEVLNRNSTALDAPTGTSMAFFQTAAPTGWTKDTTAYNHALRLTGGTISGGGSVDFTTLFARTATDGFTIPQTALQSFNLSHSLSVGTSISGSTGDDTPDHTHQTNSGSTTVQAGSGATINAAAPTASAGASTRHTHPAGSLALASGTVSGTVSSGGSSSNMTAPIDMRVKWTEVIKASKD